MGRVVTALAVVLAVAVTLAVAWFLGMRTKFPPVLDLQRRINRRVLNPRQMRTAGTPGAYAGVVHHTGRRSGRAYSTPVVPVPTDDGFVVVLPYGTRPDWVRNVLAAGAATIDHDGVSVAVDSPAIVPIAEAPVEFPPSEARSHRVMDVRDCLVVHTSTPAPS